MISSSGLSNRRNGKDGKRDLMQRRLRVFSELIFFLKTSKRWWLAPIFIFLFLLSLFVVFTESSALAPFIYSLF
ncbi:MAG: hypothetical protein KAU35_05080 [candidate division Zixibacteria bacterium]|nr:hypothetical protein [candidate division Zixibacteria bacterium]